MATTSEIFHQILPVLSSPSFLDGSLAAPGIPFYVCPYEAERETETIAMIGNLVQQLAAKGIAVSVVNLFRLMVERMKENGDLDYDLEDEPNYGKTEFLEHLQGILDISDEIVPSFRALVEAEKPRILFVTGIGAAWPVIRAHSLLMNLESAVKIPLVLFFPGDFRQIPGAGASLSLFDKLPGDGYYRAFNLLDLRL